MKPFFFLIKACFKKRIIQVTLEKDRRHATRHNGYLYASAIPDETQNKVSNDITSTMMP